MASVNRAVVGRYLSSIGHAIASRILYVGVVLLIRLHFLEPIGGGRRTLFSTDNFD